jgi:hypothetical protein
MVLQTPWAVIICELSDNRFGPTAPLERYQKLFTTAGEGTYNVIRYFRDASHGTLDLSGSQLFGTDPQNPIIVNYTLSEYQGSTPDPATRRNRLIANAKKAALDAGVPLNQFYGVVVIPTVAIGISFGGLNGGSDPTVPGVSSGPFAVADDRYVQNNGTADYAHEMGHGYSLNHSRADRPALPNLDEPPDEEPPIPPFPPPPYKMWDYADPWDIMSGFGPTYKAVDQDFIQRGPGMNAFNMFSLGWLDASRLWSSQLESFDEVVVLRPLMRYDLPGQLAATLGGRWLQFLAIVRSYIVEFRLKDGWDAGIPTSTVLVHRLSYPPSERQSYLMPNTTGQPWPPISNRQGYSMGIGDVFYVGEIGGSRSRVEVLRIDEIGQAATIRLSYSPRLPTFTMLVPKLSGPTRRQLFAVGNDGRAWQITEELPRGEFGPTWFVLGQAQNLNDITVGRNANGNLEVFALDPNPGVWHVWQTNPNTGEWSDWQPIWGADLQRIEVASNQDGRLEVFGIAKANGTMFHAWQSVNGGWSDWYQLGAAAGLQQFTVGRNGDGQLEVFALDQNPGVWHVWQTAPNAGWTEWQPWWGGTFGPLGQLSVDNSSDGRLEIFGLDNNPGAWHAWKMPNDGWSDWQPIFGR